MAEKPKSVDEGSRPKQTTLKDLLRMHDELAHEVREYRNGYQQLAESIAALTKEVERLTSEGGGKKRGPKSTRDMTEDDARRVVYGDLKKVSVKEAAVKLGLSYGQVYSARGGYTFKGLKETPEKQG